MWGEPDRASIRETLMTDSIHVASWTTTRSDTQLQFDNRSMLMHQAGRLAYACPEISTHALKSDALRLRSKLGVARSEQNWTVQ